MPSHGILPLHLYPIFFSAFLFMAPAMLLDAPHEQVYVTPERDADIPPVLRLITQVSSW
jgi:hypothetical protein